MHLQAVQQDDESVSEDSEIEDDRSSGAADDEKDPDYDPNGAPEHEDAVEDEAKMSDGAEGDIEQAPIYRR